MASVLFTSALLFARACTASPAVSKCAHSASNSPGGTLIATLDYGVFEGAYSEAYNISYYQKIPFAAPPVGENRFRAPQPPLPVKGIYNSTQEYDSCPQQSVTGSEDCLYLGLYGRPWTTGQALRPVVVNFFGGAYIEGGGSLTIPPNAYPVLNVSTENDMIIVGPNYRVNAFGFLPGKEIADDPLSDLNPGLLDQHAALQWTHQYIEHFGGDPGRVSIWGQSAGAGSVVAQVIAQDGQTAPKLFDTALASSPFWVKTYNYDAPQAQNIFDTLAEMTGCAGPLALSCLKQVDVQTIQTAALVISNSHTYNTSTYTWAPVIDGQFLTQPLSQASRKKAVNIDFGWGMYNLHEGESFVPPALQDETSSGSPPFNSSEASFDMWLRGYLPGFSDLDIELVKGLYPQQGTAENLVYNTTFVRAGLIYRDSVLACPTFWMGGAAHKEQYLGSYIIPPATHAADTVWWDAISSIQQTDPLTYDGFTGSFASFFQTSDPNAHKLTNASIAGVPELQRTSRQFVIAQDHFEDELIPQFELRCAFWMSVASKIPI